MACANFAPPCHFSITPIWRPRLPNYKIIFNPLLPASLFAAMRQPAQVSADQLSGEVAEWSKAPHSKCGIRATVSWVRIPPSPPITSNTLDFLEKLLPVSGP